MFPYGCYGGPVLPISDLELAVSVDLVLQADPDTSGAFQVSVSDGIVTLDGNANTREQQDAALAATAEVAGVKRVVNRIRIVA